MSLTFRETGTAIGTRDEVRASDTPHADSIDMVALVCAHWRLFRNVSLAVIGLTAAIMAVLPSAYSTSAVVMIEPRKNNVTDQSSVLSETPTDPSSIQNQIQLLTSRDLAARVVDKLGLASDPEFASAALNPLRWLKPAPPAGAARRRDAMITTFLKHLSVDSVGLSTTITVTFTSHDPAKAAVVANTVVDTYLGMQAAIRYEVAERTTDWLLDRIRALGQQVQSAEVAIQQYKNDHNLADTSSGGSLVDQQLAAINSQLVAAREDLAAKEAENARILALLQTGRAADISQIASSPLIIELREQQAELIRQQGELSTRYGPRHPKMIAAESQMRDLDAKIDEEVKRIAGSVENEVAVARAQVHSLEDSLQSAEGEAAEQNMARVKLQSLEANAASTRSMYEAFVSRLRETQGQNGLETVDAREISHAPVPLSPSWPPRLLAVAASVPAGVLLGFLAALLAERFEAVPQTRTETPRLALQDPFRGLTVLGDFPASEVSQCAEWILDQPLSACTQTLWTLAQRLVSDRSKIVGVTSASACGGETGIAIALARAASQQGHRTILFDGNLPAPAATRRIGLSLPSVGIDEVLRGTARFSQSLQKDPRSSSLVMSGSATGEAAHDVWTSEAMGRLMAHLRQVCDLVIIDAGSLAVEAEFPVIARLCDGLIVLTDRSTALRGKLPPMLDRICFATPTGLVLIS